MLSPTPPIRLCSILGYDDRFNDIIFCPPAIQSDEHSTVIYFGGDVQDFPEAMKLHTDNKNYIKWNLENMATLLNLNFPQSHIVVVRPSRIDYKTFSCYKNFVPSGNAGVPEHTPTHHALQHLERLLLGINQRIKSIPKSELRNMMSLSLENQQCYMIDDLIQDSLNSGNSSLKQGASTENMPTSILQRELESNKNLTVTMSNSHDYYFKTSNSVPDHHVTITSSKPPDTSETNKPETVIQATSTSFSDESSHSSPVSASNSDTSKNSQSSTKNKDSRSSSSSNTLWWYDNIALDKAKLILIGFSKGCVVLNQLIYEFHYLKTLTPDDSTMLSFVSRITEMFWLDGGHAGNKNTWITSRSLLETLTRLGIKIWIHVTPYQVQDDRRAWIRREEQTFTELLQRFGAHVSRTLHFDGALADLNMHFDILSVFRNPAKIAQKNEF